MSSRAKPAVLGILIAAGTISAPSFAEVSVRALIRAAASAPARDTERDVSAILELPEGESGASWGLPRIGSHFSVVRAPLSELDLLSRLHPDWQMTWSPPLHPLLDRAAGWARVPAFRSATGLSGKDVVVGIVDTGADCAHPDLRNRDGTTRIAYLLDFSEAPDHSQGPAPSQIVLDAEKRCAARKLTCSVRTAEDIDAALTKNDGADLPGDAVGHGTHVASLAAGNGGKEGKYVGVAPEATLVIGRALDTQGSLSDANVLAATDLVFFLADAEGKRRGLAALPAVVNLSLGSDFGPHDGSSALERSLAELVGEEHPGRAIVVAAGNSAGLFADSKVPTDRLGVHTDVQIPERSIVKVPIQMHAPPTATGNLKASIDVWIAFRRGDDVSVGLLRKGGEWIAPRPRGFAGAYGSESTVKATIVNGPRDELHIGNSGDDAAAVLIEGTFARDEAFTLELEGHGTARLWIQSEGDLGPESGTGGALFRGATRESTITLPAASPAVITVGATLNRLSWVDRTSESHRIAALGSVRDPPLDSVAFFSSAGPTTDGRLKPDLVAPGGFVVGAMSRDADPRYNPLGIFAEGFCTPIEDCAVVDGTHAVTLGTSMAAPVVAGAVALLLEKDPTLTTDRIRTLLQAGARRPTGAAPSTLRDSLSAQLGGGALDLEGIRDVLAAATDGEPRAPDARESWLSLGATYAHPDPAFSVPAVLKVKSASGRAAILDPSALTVGVERGHVTTEPEYPAPGLVRFAVAADRETGGDTLSVDVRYSGRELASESLPIAVDVNVLREGFWGRGGCSVGARSRPLPRPEGIALLSFVLFCSRGSRSRRMNRRRRLAPAHWSAKVTVYPWGSNGSKSGSNG